MSIQQLSAETAHEILSSIGADEKDAGKITPIIEKALLEVTRQMRVECTDAVNLCCPTEQDLAHKIAEELQKKEDLLISNLMSLR